jgi:hypothetical protein
MPCPDCERSIRIGRSREVCVRCRSENRRVWTWWGNFKRSLGGRPGRTYVHDGGEFDCGCSICYLRRQPLTSYQIGWLARAITNPEPFERGVYRG